MTQSTDGRTDATETQLEIAKHHYFSPFACQTRDIFETMRPAGTARGYVERKMTWPQLICEFPKPQVTLIKIAGGRRYHCRTADRPRMFLCVLGSGSIVAEVYDRESREHVRKVEPVRSDFTDAIVVPPHSDYWLICGSPPDPDSDELQLIAIEPLEEGETREHRTQLPASRTEDRYLNPGRTDAEVKKNYASASQFHTFEPTPFYVTDRNRRARRIRLWGKEGLDFEGRRDFAKPWMHLVLYTFYEDQRNAEHYHPGAFEFAYCVQGSGEMTVRVYMGHRQDKNIPLQKIVQKGGDYCIPRETDAKGRLIAAPPVSPLERGRRTPANRSPRTSRDSSRDTRNRPPETLDPDAGDVCRGILPPYPYIWECKTRPFPLSPGVAVLVPPTALHEYWGKMHYEQPLIVLASQTPQPIMHLLEHQANGKNPPHHGEPAAQQHRHEG